MKLVSALVLSPSFLISTIIAAPAPIAAPNAGELVAVGVTSGLAGVVLGKLASDALSPPTYVMAPPPVYPPVAAPMYPYRPY